MQLLADYQRRMVPVLQRHGGSIDKFMGDGIMAMFGMPRERDSHPAADAVRAGLAMLERMNEVNDYLRKNLNHEFRLGIGIDYGSVVLGRVGFRLKRQFTAIGDVVNVASRVESLTKQHGAQLLVTEAVRRNLPEAIGRFGRRFSARVEGKQHSIAVHEILPPPPPPSPAPAEALARNS